MDVSGTSRRMSAARGSRYVVLAVLAASFFFGAVVPARALMLTGRTASFRQVRCVVKIGSTDPTGTVTLLRDGTPWASRPGTPGSTLSFSNVAAVRVKPYVLTAVITTATTTVTSSSLRVRVYAVPPTPVFVGIDVSRLTARRARIRIKAGADVIAAEVYRNGRLVHRYKVVPNRVNDFGSLAMPLARNTIGIRLANPAGYRPKATIWSFGRFSYPAGRPTIIVVVKSQLRLYWIRNDLLVKSYVVATGRPSLPTPTGYWRIGAKYYTDSSSVYGPRKMRMFRLRDGHFVYTAYNMHGTNVDSSIGTYASHGCIRLHNRDILELFPQVPLYTLVQTR